MPEESKKIFPSVIEKKTTLKDLQFAYQWTNLNILHYRKDTSLNTEKAKVNPLSQEGLTRPGIKQNCR